ncbi:unnamed protein product [Paramecium sonneborni]|uniref:TLDc domain-containing protein n=1 Tax=Paramecium sonneborni TaxID=65129 RepID=A0A8S1R767_9CILI|nr:unnamed protein product [Paramecium sonneborni]
MSRANSCKIHPKFTIEWIRFYNQNIEYGCIKCLNQLQNCVGIEYLKDIIDNPEIIIPKLPIDKWYINFYQNLNNFSETQLESIYKQFETSLILLSNLLNQFIENGRSNLQQFIKQSKEAKEQLKKEFKINEIQALIKQIENLENKNSDVQDQIKIELIETIQNINLDLKKQQNSKINNILKETQLGINKFNLHCDKQIDYLLSIIKSGTTQLDQFLQQSFEAIKSNNVSTFSLTCQQSNIQNFNKQQRQRQIIDQKQMNYDQPKPELPQITYPYYFSHILPQYYFNYILNYADIEKKLYQNQQQFFSQNLNTNQMICYRFNPQQEFIVKGNCFWDFNNSKNRLMIFQSNNEGNPIFGYFSSSWKEFIFSFNHNEIYPKKEKKEDLQKNGLIYLEQNILQNNKNFSVGSFDLQINANLIDGQSLLGCDFQWDNFDAQKCSNYLFGEVKPNIKECEIFYF